jgi:hypothetical protein
MRTADEASLTARVESQGSVQLTVRMPTTPYVDQLLSMRCREELVTNNVFPNAKEVTESFAAANAVIHTARMAQRRARHRRGGR